jgi:hypothetical protein
MRNDTDEQGARPARFEPSRFALAQRPDDARLRRAQGVVLAAGTRVAPELLPLDGPRWEALARWAEDQSLLPLLHQVTEVVADTPEGVLRRVDRAARDEWIRRVGLTRLAGFVADRLDQEGIEVRFLKGIVTSHTVYADPLDRSFNDVDIVVSPDDWRRAIAALTPLFEVVPNDTMFGDTGELLHPSSTLVSREYGLELDLHRRVQGRSIGQAIPHHLVQRDPMPIALGDRQIAGMSWECQILHTCLHLSSHKTRLSTAADLLRQLLDPRTDASVLVGVAAEAQLLAALQWAVTELVSFVDLDDVGAATAVLDARVPRGQAWRWDRSLGGTAGRLAVDLHALGPRRAARLAGEVLWPSPAFLADRGRNRLGHLRYIASPVNQRRRP